MTEIPHPRRSAADLRAKRRTRHETRSARRERYFNLMASGFSIRRDRKNVADQRRDGPA